VTVGSPLELTVDPRRYQPSVRFVSPDEATPETTVGAAAAGDGRVPVVRFARTDTAGIYEAELAATTGAAEVRRWAVNVDPREGDLARLDAAELADRLAGVKYTYHPADAFEVDREDLAGYNLSDALLLVLVVWLVGEQLFAWWCSYHPPRTAAAGRGGVA
jgi:hypothetical protein